MNISINQTNITSRGKLIPKSAYKGPILKLTKAEQARIKALEENKAKLECEIYGIANYVKIKCKGNISDSLNTKWDILDHRIEQINTLIHEIKTNRLNKQIARQKKLDIKG